MARCSVPSFFGLQDWFDSRFKDLCEKHDAEYATREWKRKLAADFEISAGFVRKGYSTLGLLAFPTLLTAGSVYWFYKKITGH